MLWTSTHEFIFFLSCKQKLLASTLVKCKFLWVSAPWKYISSLHLQTGYSLQSSVSLSASSQEMFASLCVIECKSVRVCRTASTWRRLETHCSTASNSWYLQQTDSRPRLEIKAMSTSLQYILCSLSPGRQLSFSCLNDGLKVWE